MPDIKAKHLSAERLEGIARIYENRSDSAALHIGMLLAHIGATECDTERLRWAFGSPDQGASREQIEHILMHADTLEEARELIDTAMAQSQAEGREK